MTCLTLGDKISPCIIKCDCFHLIRKWLPLHRTPLPLGADELLIPIELSCCIVPCVYEKSYILFHPCPTLSPYPPPPGEASNSFSVSFTSNAQVCYLRFPPILEHLCERLLIQKKSLWERLAIVISWQRQWWRYLAFEHSCDKGVGLPSVVELLYQRPAPGAMKSLLGHPSHCGIIC